MVSPLLSMLRTRYGVTGKTDDDFPGTRKLTSGDDQESTNYQENSSTDVSESKHENTNGDYTKSS